MPARDSRPAAVYLRISLDRNDNAPGPERQEEACRTRLADTGIEVGAVFCDRDKSAWVEGTERPDFDRMMAGMAADKYSVVCVWKLDRLVRRFVQYGVILPALTAAGVRIVSTTEHIDTTTAMGKALVGFIVAQAEEESANTSLRVKAAEDARAKRGGLHSGGQRCYGYQRDGTIVPEEAAYLRSVFDGLLSGKSFRQVTDALNAAGSRTTTDREWVQRSLSQTLKSPRLRGVRRNNGALYPGTWEPIFTEEEHLRLLDHLSTGYYTSQERVGKRNLLTGLVVCGNCGEPMGTGTQGRQSEHPHKRYSCRKVPGRPSCGRFSIAMNSLDAYVRGLVIDYAAAHEEVTARLHGRRQSLEERLRDVQNGLTESERSLTELHYEMYVTNPHLKGTYVQADELLQQRVVHLRTELARLKVKLDAKSRQELVFMRAGSEPWNPGRPMEEQRAWVRQYVRRVTIAPALVRGAGFDTRRISIEWLQGEADLPPLDADEADAEAWNSFLNTATASKVLRN